MSVRRPLSDRGKAREQCDASDWIIARVRLMLARHAATITVGDRPIDTGR
jgi:hypothetical protein